MKKYLFLICLLFTVFLYGCGAGNVGDAGYMQAQSENELSSSSEENTSSMPEIHSKEAGLDNIVQYFTSMDLIDENSKSKVAYEVIGAKNGVKYSATVADSSFTLELYEFETDNLNSTAEKTINSVKNSGSFNILDTPVNAVISDNNKYLLIYGDNSDNEENIQKRNFVLEEFKTWP